MALRLLMLLTASATCGLALATDFSGFYESTGDATSTTLNINQDGTRLFGTAQQGPIKMKLAGEAVGFEAQGTLKVTGTVLYFSAKFEGSTLVLRISDSKDTKNGDVQRFNLKGKPRVESKSASDRFKTGPSELMETGKQYLHVSGAKLRYPSDWRIQEAQSYSQLIPLDAKDGEVIFVRSDSAQGATDPTSVEILTSLDSQVVDSLPDAQLSGKPEIYNSAAGKGAIVTWNCTVGGNKSIVRGYVTIVKDSAIAIVVMGTKDQVEYRDKELRQIFRTIGWGQGPLEKDLVGTWTYKGATGYATCVFKADGTFQYSNSVPVVKDDDGTSWIGELGLRQGNGWNGVWVAEGDTFTLNFVDGTFESGTFRLDRQDEKSVLVFESLDKKGQMSWKKS